MQRGLDLAVRALAAGPGVKVHRAQKFHHFAVFVLLDAFTLYDVRALEPRFAAGGQAEELGRRVLQKVLALDEEPMGEVHRARAHLRVVGMVLHFQRVDFAFGPVGQDHLDGVQYRHRPGRGPAQRLADAVLEERAVHGGVRLGDAHAGKEVLNGLRRIAAAAHGGQGGHARVVPAGDLALFHQAAQVALGHDGAGQVEPGELDLARRMLKSGLAHHPVVQRAVDLIFQRAQRVGHALQRVLQRVLEVVHRVDAPLVAGAVVVVAQDAVERRVAHQNVGRRHIDLGAQDPRAVRELARLHPAEEVQVFLDGTVAVGAIDAGLRERAAVLPHLLGGLVVHIGDALFDQPARDVK